MTEGRRRGNRACSNEASSNPPRAGHDSSASLAPSWCSKIVLTGISKETLTWRGLSPSPKLSRRMSRILRMAVRAGHWRSVSSDKCPSKGAEPASRRANYASCLLLRCTEE
jgi:hypothetical protein